MWATSRPRIVVSSRSLPAGPTGNRRRVKAARLRAVSVPEHRRVTTNRVGTPVGRTPGGRPVGEDAVPDAQRPVAGYGAAVRPESTAPRPDPVVGVRLVGFPPRVVWF